jgi:deazaflavin-dependent oxidoreductase (nitroreductase family)
MAIRRVDPTAKRGRLYLALARFSITPFAMWITKLVSWKLDPLLLRISGYRLHTGLPFRLGVLETRGAKTGKRRRHATIYFHDGDRVTIVAAYRGYPRHPAWYHNARANPDVTYNGQPFRAVAIESGPDHERLTRLGDLVYPQYAVYREWAAKSGRTIPILQLVPR